MCVGRQNRQICIAQARFQRCRALLMGGAHVIVRFQMPHAGHRTGGNSGRQRCCENKARRERADGVHKIGFGGDIAAHNAERFCQRSLDNVDARHQPFTVGNAATAWPIHAHGMHFVEIGEGIVFFGQITNFLDRCNVAIH